MARIPIAPLPGQLDSGNQTVRTAQIPVEARSATAEGLMAVADTSARIMKLAAEADDFKNMTQAGMAMQDAQMSFAKYQQENAGNESAWLDGWNKHVESVKTKVAEMRLSPTAREQMTARLSKWATEGTIQVNSEVFRQKGRNAIQILDNAVSRIGLDGDTTVVDDALQDPNVANILPAAVRESYAIRAQKEQQQKFQRDYIEMRESAVANDAWDEVDQLDEQARQRNLISDDQLNTRKQNSERGRQAAMVKLTAETDPDAARAKLKDTNLSDQDRRTLQGFIDQAERGLVIGELASIADKVAEGKITRGDQVESRFLRPAELQKIRTEIDSAPPSLDMVAAEVFKLEAEIGQLTVASFGNRDPKTTAQLVSLAARISKLPEGQATELRAQLDKRRRGENPTDKEAYIAQGIKIIDTLFEERRKDFFDDDNVLKAGKEEEYSAFMLNLTKKSEELKRRMPQDVDDKRAKEIIFNVLQEDMSAKAKRELNLRRATTSMRPNVIPPGMPYFQPIPGGGASPAIPGGSGGFEPMNPLFPANLEQPKE
jgi:hypothetical protein